MVPGPSSVSDERLPVSHRLVVLLNVELVHKLNHQSIIITLMLAQLKLVHKLKLVQLM